MHNRINQTMHKYQVNPNFWQRQGLIFDLFLTHVSPNFEYHGNLKHWKSKAEAVQASKGLEHFWLFYIIEIVSLKWDACNVGVEKSVADSSILACRMPDGPQQMINEFKMDFHIYSLKIERAHISSLTWDQNTVVEL